jgi:hypothetical protein
VRAKELRRGRIFKPVSLSSGESTLVKMRNGLAKQKRHRA